MKGQKLKQLGASGELMLILAAKEVKIKYKSAVLGGLWFLLQPLLLMLVFTFIFSVVIKIDIDHFPLFLMCALLPWFFLSMSVSAAVTSIVDNAHLIKKSFFAYEVIPLSVVLSNLVNFTVSLLLLSLMFMVLRIFPGPGIVILPFVVIMQTMFVIGICLTVSALHTFYRDVRYAVELLLIVWFYATPVFYPPEFIPEKFRSVLYLNPMSSFVQAYRQVLLYGKSPDAGTLLNLSLAGLLCLTAGFAVFAAKKRYFADVT